MQNKNIENKLFNIVRQNIIDTNIVKKNDIVVVALSGGSDSVCLFDLMMSLSEVYEFRLIPIHIHHGIRDEEADRDLEFVTKYCNENGYDLYTTYVKALDYAKDKSLSVEEAARVLRYEAFNNFYNELKNDNKTSDIYFALAHHKKDQAETIIHNIIRGTGISGLVGMEIRNGFYIRPLLNVDKEDIDEYIKHFELDYVNDSTNFDDKYTRNNIRLNILPEFQNINKNAIEHICELSEVSKEIEEYFMNKTKILLSDTLIDKNENSISLDAKKLKNFDHIIKYYIVKNIFEVININKKDISRVHYNDIIDLIDGNNNRHLDLPYNMVADKNNNILIIKINDFNLSMKNKKRR